MRPLFKVILATIINPLSDTKCDYWPSGALVLKRTPKGEYKFLECGKRDKILARYKAKRSLQVLDHSHQLIIPSFFDMHFHWVQDDVRLMPKDNLLNWLSKYTWPYEHKFKSKTFSKQRARRFANELIRCGTLGGACYASVHGHTVEHALESFKGDFILGNVLMTMNSPDYLTQSKKEAVELVQSLAKKFKNRYAVTPRFAPTTCPEVMEKTGELARRHNSFIQTHLAETPNECDYVMGMYKEFSGFEKVKSYTHIYDQVNLLGPKTIMGHGIYLSEEELKKLKKSKAAIAHCPTSNAPIKQGGLGSGLFHFKKAESYRIPWALGSDIGGGPYLSMIDVIDSFVRQNRAKKITEATYVKGLYRATLAGAKILEKGKSHGNLAPGKWANFIALDLKGKPLADAESLLKKLMSAHRKDRALYDQLVQQVWYKGKPLI